MVVLRGRVLRRLPSAGGESSPAQLLNSLPVLCLADLSLRCGHGRCPQRVEPESLNSADPLPGDQWLERKVEEGPHKGQIGLSPVRVPEKGLAISTVQHNLTVRVVDLEELTTRDPMPPDRKGGSSQIRNRLPIQCSLHIGWKAISW